MRKKKEKRVSLFYVCSPSHVCFGTDLNVLYIYSCASYSYIYFCISMYVSMCDSIIAFSITWNKARSRTQKLK